MKTHSERQIRRHQWLTLLLLQTALSIPLSLQAAENSTTPREEIMQKQDSHSNVHSSAIHFQKVDNFRDVAGNLQPYQNNHGETLQQGRLYRANALLLSPEEAEKLASLNITHIYDLRTPGEIALHPDSEIPGATWHNINLLGWDDIEPVRVGFTQKPEITIAGAEEIYLNFVNDPITRAQIGTLLTEIAQNEGNQLFHCSGGKDRTGWVSALLQYIAGVSQEEIVADFLASNEYSRHSITQSFNKMATEKGVAAAIAFSPFLGVQDDWLLMAFSEAENQYGSIDNYLLEGLAITPETQTALRNRLLIP
ncbi:tyrosine-protein phosphatase [Ignatzschineria cameli]|nr:tyrosine-protein phosphatase [Ignatzschineria cameli]